MEYPDFHNLWEQSLAYFQSPLSSWLGESLAANEFSLINDAEKKVYRSYELIKTIAKECYFDPSVMADITKEHNISMYKRAAVLSYAVLEIMPFQRSIKRVSEENLSRKDLFNEYFAFYIGLHSLLIDFPDEIIDKLLRSDRTKNIFCFPKIDHEENYPQNGVITYADSVAVEFQFAHKLHNFNILSVADKYFLLLKRCSYLGEKSNNKVLLAKRKPHRRRVVNLLSQEDNQ